MRGVRRGARVRITTLGTVVQTGTFSDVDRAHVELLRESDGMRNIAMLDAAQLEETDPDTGGVPDRGWRDVCADMIRLGHDDQALALLRENAPDTKEMPDLHDDVGQVVIMFDDVWDATGNVVIGTKALIEIGGLYDNQSTVEIRPAVSTPAHLSDLMIRVGKEILRRLELEPKA